MKGYDHAELPETVVEISEKSPNSRPLRTFFSIPTIALATAENPKNPGSGSAAEGGNDAKGMSDMAAGCIAALKQGRWPLGCVVNDELAPGWTW
jgi:hypothetical protein